LEDNWASQERGWKSTGKLLEKEVNKIGNTFVKFERGFHVSNHSDPFMRFAENWVYGWKEALGV